MVLLIGMSLGFFCCRITSAYLFIFLAAQLICMTSENGASTTRGVRLCAVPDFYSPRVSPAD